MFIRLYGLSLCSLLWSIVVAKVITSTNCRLRLIPVGAVKEMYQIRLWIVWQFWTLLSGTRDLFFPSLSYINVNPVVLMFAWQTPCLYEIGPLRNMGYWPNVKSRWLDISQVLFLREQNPISSHLTEQAWSIKDLLYGIKHHNMINVPCGTQPVSRAGKMAPSCPLG